MNDYSKYLYGLDKYSFIHGEGEEFGIQCEPPVALISDLGKNDIKQSQSYYDLHDEGF